MNGGRCLDIVLQICKSWQFEFLVKLTALLGVKGIGARYYKTRNYDPIDIESIDIESIDKTEFWIIEEERLEHEEPPLLDYDKLEKMLYEEDEPPQYKRQCHDDVEDDMEVELLGDDIDLGSFGDLNIDNRSTNPSSSANANENDDDDCLNYRP
ncbi:hypothetical protein CsSME_00004425 [Camellia sinensis var. sinensis]